MTGDDLERLVDQIYRCRDEIFTAPEQRALMDPLLAELEAVIDAAGKRELGVGATFREMLPVLARLRECAFAMWPHQGKA